MSDVTLLKNAISRNATVGATPPHGPVKTGELPLVHVKPAPGGPQVQEGQQKPVTILPPKDAEAATKTGGLPMVQVKMTQNGPQPDDGRDQPVVVKNSKHGAVAAGGLPMIQVKMDGGKPQIQTIPNVANGPPQIPAAPPVLSTPRGARVAAPVNQGYVARPAMPGVSLYAARAAAPASPHATHVAHVRVASPTTLPPVPELTTDQLMLCRHVVGKYLADLLAAAVPSDPSAELPVKSDAIALAEATIATIDDALVAVVVRAEAAAKAALAPAVSVAPPVAAAAATASIAPVPSVSYVAGRVGGRHAGRAQRNAGMAPRRTPRGPLPPVIVKMDGQRPVLQNQAEVAQAKAALEAQLAQSDEISEPDPVVLEVEGTPQD